MRPPCASLKRCALVEPLASFTIRRYSSQSRSVTRQTTKMGDAPSTDDYTKWTKDSLIERLRRVEAELKTRPSQSVPATAPAPRKRKEQAKLDPANYNTRYVALRLAYLGRNYGGFEYSSSGTLPSIEEELFKALTKACLIFPNDERVVDFSTCEYSKCGRTDRGVSAFGQVIGIRLRSARPVPGRMKRKKQEKKKMKQQKERADQVPEDEDTQQPENLEPPPFDPIRDELQYPRILNRLLPPDIRILAWCPSPPPDFSARFSCREREYRYFFTQPAFNPPPPTPDGQPHTGWLDIEAMRDAAARFEGDQDFQNFCKIDPSKNITSYQRRILESGIYEAEGMGSTMPHLPAAPPAIGHTSSSDASHPKVYYFRVRGTAFLWHQIRHMVSVLFHVGQGLESPDVVDKLLDAEANPRRPTYTMADEVPLVLWDCSFRDESGRDLEWIHVDDDLNPNRAASAVTGTADSVWRLWREAKMDEILANGLLGVVTSQSSSAPLLPTDAKAPSKKGEYSTKRFEGGNGPRAVGKYTAIMDMPRMDSPGEQNDRFAQRKGFANHGELLKHKAAEYEAKFNKKEEEQQDE